ncbi:MAG: 3-deoxy-manno-octulosonate cytidylyltransferase [Puniceicoccales bacterium]|jgi:3-deoxy-manno-octulosonate cytidylyltransferase (CMP-KDO synthetase)|nr:3-deoxy-manno-octulosonate cytidylyltransferase [Puniceicoccales bacterium]
MNRCAIAIPARMASTRLPGKMLADLCGKPVVQHVIERMKRVRGCKDIYVVTDSEEILALAKALSVEALLTSPTCRSGSERIASVVSHMRGDWIFNVQGDEPFVDPVLVENLLDQTNRIEVSILTPIFRIQSQEDLFNPNVVKVVLDNRKNALYFSRNPIPFVRGHDASDWLSKCAFWGHIGIYGYRRDLLGRYAQIEPSELEVAESLEQLRFLSSQYRIATYETNYRPVAIDTKEDLAFARTLIQSGGVC